MHVSSLDSSVLVLNKLYAAIRITSARRAFLLLCREAAEVVTTEHGGFQTYDFGSWMVLSELIWLEFTDSNGSGQSRNGGAANGNGDLARGPDRDPGPDRDRDRDDPERVALTEWVHTPRVVVAVPRVIRLLRYNGRPQPDVRLTRRNIHARDRGRCHYCGRRVPARELTIDHVVPRTLGGGDTWDNLVSACAACNSRKGGRTPQAANMRLLRRPTKPKTNPAIATRLQSPKYREWRAFVDESHLHVGST